MAGMPDSRTIALGLCVMLLGGLFILGGAGYPTPVSSTPDLTDSTVDPAEHVGTQVETGGTVIATDPVIIEIDRTTEPLYLPITKAPEVQVGHDVIVDGTLTPDGTLSVNADRAVTREPWEVQYMYAISAVAVLIIAGRGIDGWQLDQEARTVTPRETPLHQRYLGDHISNTLTGQRDDDA